MNIETVLQQFQEQLKMFVNRRVHHKHDAEDVLQIIFLKMIAELPKLRNHEKVHAWIFQIARNVIVDYYRKNKMVLELPEDSQVPDEQEPNLNAELACCISCFINHLPEKYRNAINLVEIQGYSQIQLSQQLNLSISGAKSRVQRGRQKLKELIIDCCKLALDRFGNILEIEPKRKTMACDTGCGCN